MKDANLVVRIPSEKKKELQAHAEKNGVSASSLTLALIDEELKTQSLSNMYLTITKRFEGVDEKLKVLAKIADGNFNTINENVLLTMRNQVKTLDCIQEYWRIHEKDHKSLSESLSLTRDVLKSVAEILGKLDENSVTKDQLTKILVKLLAKEEKK